MIRSPFDQRAPFVACAKWIEWQKLPVLIELGRAEQIVNVSFVRRFESDVRAGEGEGHLGNLYCKTMCSPLRLCVMTR